MWHTRQDKELAYDYMLKIIVVGDSSVGKSCLLLRYADKRFRHTHEVTIGVEFGSRIVEFQGIRFKSHVWDTAGQESFRSITRSYYRTAAVALMVFDVTKRSTFEHLRQWTSEVFLYAAPGVVMAIIANKIDLDDVRQVSRIEAESFATELGALYFETSAKEASGVDDAFISPCIIAIGKQPSAPSSTVHKLVPQTTESEASCCHR